MSLSVAVVRSMDALLAIEAEWRELLADSDANEPTLTPEWLETWWAVFADTRQRRVTALVFRCKIDGRLVGLAPLQTDVYRHHGLVLVERLELLGSGEPVDDEIYSEYLSVIVRRGWDERVAASLAEALRGPGVGRWVELRLALQNGDLPWTRHLLGALIRAGLSASERKVFEAPRIALPARFADYVAQLSSQNRYLVRRSRRDFEKWGGDDIVHHLARSPAEVAEGWRIMTELHAENPIHPRTGDAFASARFRRFHAIVLPRLLAAGCLELSWITVRGEPVVALYNIVWNGCVYFYQSARSTDLPKGIRPGIVAHGYAVERAIEAGRSTYDFLAGATRYKEQLATGARPVVEITVRRLAPSLVAVAAADALARAVRPLRRRLKRP